MSHESLFGELRALLFRAGEGTAREWLALCALVEQFEPARFEAEVLAYVLAHRQRWPSRLRMVPRRWLSDTSTWPYARIADGLVLDAHNAANATQYLQGAPGAPHLAALIVDLLLADEPFEPIKHALEVGLLGAKGLSEVRRLYVLPGDWSDAKALSAFLSAPMFARLEEVVVRGGHPGSQISTYLSVHQGLKVVDVSARDIDDITGLPTTVERLQLQYCSEHEGVTQRNVSWFEAEGASLKALWLSNDQAQALLERLPSAWHRLSALEFLACDAALVERFLAYEPLRRAWAGSLRGLDLLSPSEPPQPQSPSLFTRLAELTSLELLDSVHLNGERELELLLAGCPRLENLIIKSSFNSSWWPRLTRGAGARLRALSVQLTTQEAIEGLYALEPEAWPRLEALTFCGRPVDEERDDSITFELHKVRVLSQLTQLSIDQGGEDVSSGSLKRCLSQGMLEGLVGFSLDMFRGELRCEDVYRARWPKLRALSLSTADRDDSRLDALFENPTLEALRWLELSSGYEDEDNDAATLARRFAQAPYLGALEYLSVAQERLTRAMRHEGKFNEWLQTNRMMYWYYRDNPHLLGLIDLFGVR